MPQKNNKKKLPDFSQMSTAQEVAFWDEAELTDYIDEVDIKRKKIKLQLKDKSTKSELVSFRLEEGDLIMLKSQARDIGVGYSTLLRMLVRRFLTQPDRMVGT